MSMIYCSTHGTWDSDEDRHCPRCADMPIKAEVPWTFYLPITIAGVCVGEHETECVLIVDTDGDLEEVAIPSIDGTRISRNHLPDAHSEALWTAANAELRRLGSALHVEAICAVTSAIRSANF